LGQKAIHRKLHRAGTPQRISKRSKGLNAVDTEAVVKAVADRAGVTAALDNSAPGGPRVTFSGTPAAAGSFPVVVRLWRDLGPGVIGEPFTATLTMTVGPALSVTGAPGLAATGASGDMAGVIGLGAGMAIAFGAFLIARRRRSVRVES